MHRCSICNAVSDKEISNSNSEYKPNSWHVDPNNPLFMVCHDCNTEINEVIGEFNEAEDEVNPTEEFWENVFVDFLEEELAK